MSDNRYMIVSFVARSEGVQFREIVMYSTGPHDDSELMAMLSSGRPVSIVPAIPTEVDR